MAMTVRAAMIPVAAWALERKPSSTLWGASERAAMLVSTALRALSEWPVLRLRLLLR